MFAIAKRGFGLKLLAAMPLAAGIAIVSTSLSTVQSQTLPSDSVEPSTQLPAEIAQFSVNSQPIAAGAFLDASQHVAIFPEPSNVVIVANNSQPGSQTIGANREDLDVTIQKQNLTNTPIPGTSATSANTLSAQPSAPVLPADDQSAGSTAPSEVSQLPVVDPGKRTRGGSSYIGIGANLGLSGNTALGDANFTVISKIGLTRSLALRPGAVIGNNPTILLPLTYEFSIRPAEALQEALRIAPYVGGGVTISTGDNNNVGVLLTGGVDIPISRQFTGNAALNVGIADETDIGLSLGVGYNFNGLGI